MAEEAPALQQQLNEFDDDQPIENRWRPPIIIEYSQVNDDVNEKVSQFEFKRKQLTEQQTQLIKVLKKKAAESKGTVTVRLESYILAQRLRLIPLRIS